VLTACILGWAAALLCAVVAGVLWRQLGDERELHGMTKRIARHYEREARRLRDGRRP